MTECVILFRNPSNGKVGFIQTDALEGEILVLDEEDAIKLAQDHALLKHWAHQIVKLDEL
jgi:hypothetical protein